MGLQSAEFDGYLSQAEDRPLNEGVEYYVQAEQYLNNQAVFIRSVMKNGFSQPQPMWKALFFTPTTAAWISCTLLK